MSVFPHQIKPGDDLMYSLRLESNKHCKVIAVADSQTLIVRDLNNNNVMEVSPSACSKIDLGISPVKIGQTVIIYGRTGKVLNENLLHIRTEEGKDLFVSQEACNEYKYID